MFDQKIKKIKSINLKHYVSPAVLLIYFTVLFVLFALLTKYLSGQINRMVANDDKILQGQLLTLDMNDYNLIMKKLNQQTDLNIVTEQFNASSTIPEASDLASSTTSVDTEASTTSPIP